MATAMREFADDIDEGANEAHTAIQGLVGSAGGSLAVEALNAHWGKINGTHCKDLAECGRMAATAMDGVAVLIEGAKIGALVQLGILAAEVIAAQAAAPFTFGLSEVGALAATQATRLIVQAALQRGLPAGRRTGHQHRAHPRRGSPRRDGRRPGRPARRQRPRRAGRHGPGPRPRRRARKASARASRTPRTPPNPPPTTLWSSSAPGRRGGGGVGGPAAAGAGGSGGFSFDPDEHDRAVTGLQSAGGTFRNKAGGKIGRAKSHHGRTRGKDAIADAANAMLDKVIDGIEDGVKKTAKHLDDNMTRGIKQMAKNHHDNDKGLADHFNGLGKERQGETPRHPTTAAQDRRQWRRNVDGSRRAASPRGPRRARRQASEHRPPHNNDPTDDGKCNGLRRPGRHGHGQVFTSPRPTSPCPAPCRWSSRGVRVRTASAAGSARPGPPPPTSAWKSTTRASSSSPRAACCCLRHPRGREQRSGRTAGPRWPLTRTHRGDWAVHDPDTGHTRHFTAAPHDPAIALLRRDIRPQRPLHHLRLRRRRPAPPPHPPQRRLPPQAHQRRTRPISARDLAGAGETAADQLIRATATTTAATSPPSPTPRGLLHPVQLRRPSTGSPPGPTPTTAATSTRYDDDDRCISQGGADGPHRATGSPTTSTDPDTGHRVTTATNGHGHTTRYLINDRLQVVAETDPLGNTTRTAYDRTTASSPSPTRWAAPPASTYDDARPPHRRHPPGRPPPPPTYNDLGLPVDRHRPRRHHLAPRLRRPGQPHRHHRPRRRHHPLHPRRPRPPHLRHRRPRAAPPASTATPPACRSPSPTRSAPSPTTAATPSAAPPPSPTRSARPPT